MESIFLDRLIDLGNWAYLIFFLGMFLSEDVFLFAASFLVHEGFLDGVPTAAVISAGALSSDIFWHWLGGYLKNPKSKLLTRMLNLASPFDAHLKERTFHTIFIGRFTYGLYRAILIRSGFIGLKLKEVIGPIFVSGLVWASIVATLGYSFGASLSLVKEYFKFAEIALLVAVLLFYIGSHWAADRLKKRL